MATLWLDYRQNRPTHWSGPLLLVLVLAAMVWSAAYYIELNARVISWEDKLARMEREQGRRAPDGAGDGNVEGRAQELKQAGEVLRQLSLPWEQLFLSVESAAGDEVSLLALEPDTEKQVVKISGEARDFVALMNYITRLETQELLGPVNLQSHQVQQQDPNRPVRFALIAAWRGKS